MRRISLVALVAVFVLSGCSWAFVNQRPPTSSDKPPLERERNCTTSKAAPVLDTVGASVGFLFTLAALRGLMHVWVSPEVPVGLFAMTLGSAAGTGAYVGSAVYGYRETGECRTYRQMQ